MITFHLLSIIPSFQPLINKPAVENIKNGVAIMQMRGRLPQNMCFANSAFRCSAKVLLTGSSRRFVMITVVPDKLYTL